MFLRFFQVLYDKVKPALLAGIASKSQQVVVRTGAIAPVDFDKLYSRPAEGRPRPKVTIGAGTYMLQYEMTHLQQNPEVFKSQHL